MKVYESSWPDRLWLNPTDYSVLQCLRSLRSVIRRIDSEIVINFPKIGMNIKCDKLRAEFISQGIALERMPLFLGRVALGKWCEPYWLRENLFSEELVRLLFESGRNSTDLITRALECDMEIRSLLRTTED